MSLAALVVTTALAFADVQDEPPADPSAPAPALAPAPAPTQLTNADAEEALPPPAPPPATDAPAGAANGAVPDENVRTASNAIFAEVFGSGLLYSVNYERIIESWGVGFRGGLSYFTYPVSSYGRSGNLSLFTVPLMASWYWGTERHKLQLGLGGTIIYLGASTDSQGTEFAGERAGLGIAATAIVGYRYLPPKAGITFGVGFTPLIRPGRALAWGGATCGYIF